MWSLLCFVMFEGDLAAQSERKPEHTPTSYKTPTLAVCIPRCTEACRKESGQSRPAGAHRGGNCSLGEGGWWWGTLEGTNHKTHTDTLTLLSDVLSFP